MTSDSPQRELEEQWWESAVSVWQASNSCLSVTLKTGLRAMKRNETGEREAPVAPPPRSCAAFLFDARAAITDKCGVHLVSVDTCADTQPSSRAGGRKMRAGFFFSFNFFFFFSFKFFSESVLVSVGGFHKSNLTQ